MNRKDLKNQLEQFKKLSVSGQYQESIHQFLMRETDPALSGVDLLGLKIKLHYAMALQHAGLFLNASEYFQLIKEECESHKRKPGGKYDGIRQTAVLHLSILLERLKKPKDALKILDDLGEISESAVRLAWASPISFRDITYMKSYLQLGQLELIKPVIKRALVGDLNQQLWGGLFAGIVSFKEGKKSEYCKARSEILNVLDTIEDKDPHGAPWFSLTAGQYLIDKDRQFAKKLLLRSDHKATQERKLFIVAEASHYLSKIYKLQKKRVDAARCIRRAVGGYQRCGVLLRPPLQEEVYKEIIALHGEDRGRRIFTLTAGIIDPHSLKFGQMCTAHADARTKKERVGHPKVKKTEAWKIFEEFVADWARIKFGGEIKECNGNEHGIDVVCTQGNGCIFIQAKLYSYPKNARPSSDLPLKRIQEKYGKMSKYVFVVASQSETGWKIKDWDAAYDEKVWELVPGNNRKVFDQAVTEPALQIDTVLESFLFDKYFRYHLE